MSPEQKQALNKFHHPGRMLSGGKIAPKGHVCVWNANIFTAKNGKIWFGDLDLTRDAEDLFALSKGLGVRLHILKEMDGRFTHKQDPVWSRAVAIVDPFHGVVLTTGKQIDN